MVDGDEVQAPVLAVDVRDELGDLALEARRVGQGGGGDLDEDDLPSPLRIVLEELLKRFELLNNTLDDIELVATDDDLLALIQGSKSFELGLDTRS